MPPGPICFYRNGFGLVVGRSALMLEHRDRLTGRVETVLLHVLDRPERHLVLVGPRADDAAPERWLASLSVQPRCRVWCGRHQGATGLARVLDAREAETWCAARRLCDPAGQWSRLVEVELRPHARTGASDARPARIRGRDPALGSAFDASARP